MRYAFSSSSSYGRSPSWVRPPPCRSSWAAPLSRSYAQDREADRLPDVMCEKPYRRYRRHGVEEWPCSKCLSCRFNRRRTWTSRLVLESLEHSVSSFVTLTFREEDVPLSVSVRDAQLFLKRVRRAVAPARLRYFIVGEYGDATWRPHYHAALFGLFPADHVHPARGECRCVICTSWGKGGVDVKMLAPELCQYLAGYVVKKMTGEADARLDGREPEFARMSLRPGIGAGVVPRLADAMVSEVPTVVRFGRKLWPLGRYIRTKVAQVHGLVSPGRGAVVDRGLGVCEDEEKRKQVAANNAARHRRNRLRRAL